MSVNVFCFQIISISLIQLITSIIITCNITTILTSNHTTLPVAHSHRSSAFHSLCSLRGSSAAFDYHHGWEPPLTAGRLWQAPARWQGSQFGLQGEFSVVEFLTSFAEKKKCCVNESSSFRKSSIFWPGCEIKECDGCFYVITPVSRCIWTHRAEI